MKVNEELNNILVAAYAEAQSREHEYLTPEHILFASLFFEEAKVIIRRCGGNVDGIKKKIEDLGGDVIAGTPAEFASWMKENIAEWGAVIREANIKVE